MPSMDSPAIKVEERALVEQCCSLSMRAHHSTASPFLVQSLPGPSPCSIFAFPSSWSAEDWIASDAGHFGEAVVDPSLFPSLKRVGEDVPARVNVAFVRSFQRILRETDFQAEVHRAVSEKKRMVFTGHSSGGSISILATIWILEHFIKSNIRNQVSPLCITFGSPLIGDGAFCDALQREDWSKCFLHFTMTLDIVPRVLLAPLSSFREEFQAILHFICPKSLCFSLNSIGKSQLVTLFYSTVLRSALSISKQQACLSMGSTNPLLGALSSFVRLSPYRPFGTYIFCNSNQRLVCVKNSDAILQLLFYCLQWAPEKDVTDVACSSLKEHLQYELTLKEALEVQNIFYVDSLEAIPFSLNDGDLDEFELFELGMDARLSLRAAGVWEMQRQKNQARIDANYNKIQESLNKLNEYRAACEIRGLGYYDTFKLQRHEQDFNANVRRLELAGLWDEIVEMLKRHELPDSFEGREEWVKLGTSYRLLVEPLDIANYYRHSKNEDTGPYMVKGRPKRYCFTQRWLEHAEKIAAGSSSESCFWALVEELCIATSNNKPFEEIKERILGLENEVLQWLTSGKLGRDLLLNGSTFVKWWRTLPKQHRLESCIARFMNVDEGLGRDDA